VDRLTKLGAATIAFDMVFAEPDRTSLSRVAKDLEMAGAQVILPAGLNSDNDAVLAQSFGRSNVTAGFRRNRRDSGRSGAAESRLFSRRAGPARLPRRVRRRRDEPALC
jgi:adenylate cyclase